MSHTDAKKELGVKVDKFLGTRIPILDQIYDLCQAIEKCGASPELTDAVTKAGALREPISELVNQAIALGIGEGIVSVSSTKPELGEVQPEEPSLVCSGGTSSSNSSFTDPSLIRELRECIGNRNIKSYGLHELVVARLAKELGGSVDDIKVNSNDQQSVNTCDTASSDALTAASQRGLCGADCKGCAVTTVFDELSNLPAFPWENIPTQQVLKYVGPVSFAYVWAVTNEQLGHWKCTISLHAAPQPTPEITANGITEEVAFASAIRALKEVAYKNDWVLG